MDEIWSMVAFEAGVVAFVLVFQLLHLPEWTETCVKNKKPRGELEQQLADLQRRVSELESKNKS